MDGHLTREVAHRACSCWWPTAIPVALSDGEQVAMLHCGWRPLAGGIVEKAVAGFAAPPAAAVGPGIGGCCYEVGDEVLEAFSGIDGVAVRAHARSAGGDRPLSWPRRASPRWSTWTAARAACRTCTSHTAATDGVTGRQAGIIVRDGS